MEESKAIEEKNYRINLKQNAKGQAYYDVTVRADTKEELQKRLDEAIEIAVLKANDMNKAGLTP